MLSHECLMQMLQPRTRTAYTNNRRSYKILIYKIRSNVSVGWCSRLNWRGERRRNRLVRVFPFGKMWKLYHLINKARPTPEIISRLYNDSDSSRNVTIELSRYAKSLARVAIYHSSQVTSSEKAKDCTQDLIIKLMQFSDNELYLIQFRMERKKEKSQVSLREKISNRRSHSPQ